MSENTAIENIFTAARTHRFFTDQQVDEALLYQLYEMMKYGPTTSNLTPMRISFVKSEAHKQLVIDAAAEGNKEKIRSAPVVAIIARDTQFHDHIEQLAPHMNADGFRQKSAHSLEQVAHENSWLQAGYFILAARALGLDCGPMAGFDKTKIDSAFYSDSTWRSEMLINLGYGDSNKLHPRAYRLPFEAACTIL